MTPELQASYQRCRVLLAEHGRTYHLASRLLPRATQPAVWALYGFARYVDDLVDVELSRTPGAEVVDRIEAELMSGIDRGGTAHPLLAATVDTVLRHDIDPGWLSDFLTSMRMDLEPREYPTWDALSRYTWGSAAVIGLQMAQVIGIRDDRERALACAAALGEAFQITNFCRDYDEDRARGRVYLPTELFERAGIEPGARHRERLRQVVREAAAYAHALYDKAEPGIHLLERDGQPCIRAAFILYRGILDEIERAGFDVLDVRHRVGRARRLRVAVPLLASSLVTRVRAHPAPHREH